METPKQQNNNEFSHLAGTAMDEFQKIVTETETNIETTLTPIRESVFAKFPTLFILLVTFGAVATFTGVEQLLIQQPVLQEHPVLIFTMGIVILIATGSLYKKLG